MRRPPWGGKARDAVEAFGAEASSREITDWTAVCPDGGTLLKTFICTAALGEAGVWQFGRLFISELGFLFGAGVAWPCQSCETCSSFLRWYDVQDLEQHASGPVDAEVVVSVSEKSGLGVSRLCLKMAQTAVLWLMEIWRFCCSGETMKSGRRSSCGAKLQTCKSRRTFTRAKTVTFTVPGLLDSDDEGGPSPLTRSGSDSCLVAPVHEEEPSYLLGAVVSEPEEEASPRVERSDEGLDDRGKRILAHWPTMQDLLGVRPASEEAAWSALQKLADWESFDMFAIEGVTPKPLAFVGHTVLASLGFLDTLDLPDEQVNSVLSAWESGYRRDVSFHTSLHAANVTQAVHHSLAVEGVGSRLSHNVSLSMLLAAMVHDVGHPGVNNHFLVSNRDPLALQFNDRSVLENLHCSLCFELLEASGVSLFGALGKEAAVSVRKRMTKIVLETDMARHKKGIAEVAALACQEDFSWADPETQSMLSSAIVHCHDVSNPCRPWDSFVKWTNLVMEEFFSQADLERQLGLDFSGGLSRGYAPLDRVLPFNVPQFQLGFARNVVHPMCVVLSAVPGLPLQCQRDHLDANIKRLAEESEQWVARHTPAAVASP